MLYGAHSQAGMLDDILDWFSGGDETQETSKADPESETSIMTSAVKSATAAAKSATVNAGLGFMPKVVRALGVTEKQSKGGSGLFSSQPALGSPRKTINSSVILFRISTVISLLRPRLIS
jgi:hypothetical protein